MTPAHSSFQYNLLLEYYRNNDADNFNDSVTKMRIINGLTSFTRIRNLFLTFWLVKNGELKCVYCQNPLTIYGPISHRKLFPKDFATVDHFIPKSQGGLRYVGSNLLPCCCGCNSKRGTLPAYKVTETKYIW